MKPGTHHSDGLLALSVVAPSGANIVSGRKTLEVRSWRPDRLPLHDLLIVENHRYLTQPGDTDPEGRAVALVDVIEVRPWVEDDVAAACAREWAPGYWAWVLSSVRPIRKAALVTAELRLYRPDLPYSALEELGARAPD